MILTDEQASLRLNNPFNLINKIGVSSRQSTAMSLFGMNKSNEVKEVKDKITDALKGSQFHVVFQKESEPAKITEDKVETTSEASDKSLVKRFNDLLKKDEKEIEELKDNQNNNPTLDDLITNSSAQVRLVTAHNNALDVVNTALLRLQQEVPNMKGDKIPAVIAAASKVVETIRKEKIDLHRNNKNPENIHFHYYSPKQKSMSDYQVIEVESRVISDESAA